jgi:CheY-like chemotaxis protein
MSAPATGSGSSILLADDEPGMRDLFRYCFEPHGHRIHTAVDGLEALEAVRRYAYDLVVLDVHMPRMTGPEALVEIHKLRPAQKVLILSSSSDLGHTFEDSVSRRGIPCLFKPISLDDLTEAIDTLLTSSTVDNGENE